MIVCVHLYSTAAPTDNVVSLHTLSCLVWFMIAASEALGRHLSDSTESDERN